MKKLLLLLTLLFIVPASAQQGTIVYPVGSVCSDRTTETSAINNTETVVVSCSFPANSLVAGAHYYASGSGLHTNTTTSTTGIYRIRIGPTTLTGAVVGQLNYAYGATARTNCQFQFGANIRIVSATTGWAILETNQCTQISSSSAVTTPVVIDTTVANLIELTYESGGASTSEIFVFGTIERVY